MCGDSKANAKTMLNNFLVAAVWALTRETFVISPSSSELRGYGAEGLRDKLSTALQLSICKRSTSQKLNAIA
jgi:hypothetical protein